MPGKIITISQQKGGTGKTTLTAHLAICWSKLDGMSVAVLDIDPQGSLGEWLEARERSLGEDDVGLAFRTASGWGARREARALARDYDMVIIDTPPKAETEVKPALEAADLVVVPVQPTPMDLWATEPILTLAARERTEAILVLNRVPSRSRLTADMRMALKEFPAETTETFLGNRVVFASSVGAGLTALETEPGGKASQEVQALAKELLKRLS
ncbi:MAG: ParA family partition ATPase [Alphaproteobacteria bacterium]